MATMDLVAQVKEALMFLEFDVNQDSNLHITACEGHVEVVQLLLCYKANIDARDRDGISKETYQVAKWIGTKVSLKILDKDSYFDPESVNAFKDELTLLEETKTHFDNKRAYKIFEEMSTNNYVQSM
ncbi:unnamed protein product [Lactuca saligna]|uniref:Uncharacterized protein n=1 Tax=Lactuca saligna TaxID=75948 RepID=A0AA35UML6_LACSI|nr:unnamed protein product [Lactuca saligna]